MVNNERESYSRRTVQWEGGAIRFTSVGFEHVVTGGLGASAPMQIDRPALEKLVSETRAADVIYCESPEALLLWYVYLRRGLPLPPFVIEDEDVLFRVTALARWIEQTYGESVLSEFLSDKRHVWLHHNKAHREELLRAGIRADRLFHLPCSSYLIRLVAPDAYDLMKRRVHLERPDALASRPLIVCPGANRRDYGVFVRAVCELDAKACILGFRDKGEAPESPNVAWKRFMPLKKFLEILSRAAVIVVPLLDTRMSGGENSITFSMALGKPVVATRTTATREMIVHGKNGLLVPAGDAEALRDTIRRLLDDSGLRESLGTAARKTERALAAATRRTLLRAFRIADHARRSGE